MTSIQTEEGRIAALLVEAYLDGRELVVEATGCPVIYTGLYSRRHTEEFVFADADTRNHLRNRDITVKGMKRSELL